MPALGEDPEPPDPPSVRMGPCHQQCPVFYFPAALMARQEQRDSPCQLHIAPSQGKEILAHPSIGTAQLGHWDTTAETQTRSSGATYNAVAPAERCRFQRDWVHSSLGNRARFTTDLSTFTLARSW